MNIQYPGEPAAVLASEIGEARSLADIDAAIEEFSDAMPYQVVHIGVCQKDNISVRDLIYSRPFKDTTVSLNDCLEGTRSLVITEALSLMAPFDLMTHKFQTCKTGQFKHLRETAGILGVEGAIVVPYLHENTMSVIVICLDHEVFLANMGKVLPVLYLLMSKIFTRFPTLAKWPEEYLLTDREAEVLQISSQGALEKDIAVMLGISVNTVRVHIENTKRKLSARSKGHAVMIAAQLGEINAMTEQVRR